MRNTKASDGLGRFSVGVGLVLEQFWVGLGLVFFAQRMFCELPKTGTGSKRESVCSKNKKWGLGTPPGKWG